MRVTNKMLSDTFLSDLRNNLTNMQTLQQQMASGKQISKPSDNPAKAARIMQINTDIDANTQYNSNITDATNWLDTTDTALGQADNILQRVKELLVSAGDGAYSADEKQAIKDEINQNISGLSQILNTQYDGKYLFGGSRGSAKPTDSITDPTTGNSMLIYYSKTSATGLAVGNPPTASNSTAADLEQYNQIDSKLSLEVSKGVTIDYNVSASDIIEYKDQNGNTADLRTLLTSIVNHLDGKNADGTTPKATDPDPATELTTTDLQGITDSFNNLLNVRSEVGAKENRMQNAQSENQQENLNMTDILSKTEDIDIAKTTMDFSMAQTVYMASLQTSAKILPPTLLDYLH